MSIKRKEEVGAPPRSVGRAVLRPMSVTDLQQVIRIEHTSFPTPWTLELFVRELSLKFSHNFVLDLLGMVIGYINFWIVAGEMHIMSIAVHEEYRGKKVGTMLLERSLAYAQRHGAEYVHLEVRKNNDAGIALYHGMGFEVVGVRKGYYTDTGEDALIMARHL
ncbi:MAG: ribosomal protein S18-alanine N-acetyltransferase [Deltaproteobacteria bacterium]|nr:ribosomal protein S18-alanine N-acetyltransferase [Candidatus Zymogenaceae bacterium]